MSMLCLGKTNLKDLIFWRLLSCLLLLSDEGLFLFNYSVSSKDIVHVWTCWSKGPLWVWERDDEMCSLHSCKSSLSLGSHLSTETGRLSAQRTGQVRKAVQGFISAQLRELKGIIVAARLEQGI